MGLNTTVFFHKISILMHVRYPTYRSSKTLLLTAASTAREAPSVAGLWENSKFQGGREGTPGEAEMLPEVRL